MQAVHSPCPVHTHTPYQSAPPGTSRPCRPPQNPQACVAAIALSTLPALPGAAYKACNPDADPGTQVPTVARLLRTTPRLSAFFSYLVQANLSSAPGNTITGEALTGGVEVTSRPVEHHEKERGVRTCFRLLCR